MSDLTFSIVCKSYVPDFDRLLILFESIKKYNRDNIPFIVICPKSDFNQLTNKLGNCDFLTIMDEDIIDNIGGQMSHFNRGWINQQVIKSFPHKADPRIKNFLMIDSDCIFIRDFYKTDFIVGNKIPYTVCHEQKDLFSWFSNNKNLFNFDPKKSFEETRQPIKDIFGNNRISYDFGPIPIICSCPVWDDLLTYCNENKISIYDLFYKHPSEFTWYGEVLMATNRFPIYPREPLFKVFHYMQQYVEYKQKGVSLEQISENYFGVVMQSSSGLPLIY